MSKVENKFLSVQADIDEEQMKDGVYFMIDSRLDEVDFNCISCSLIATQLSTTKPELS